MGVCHSKSDREGASQGGPLPTQPARPINPPCYEINHNGSCKALRQWEQNGGTSRNYKYVVYVNNNNLLDKSQKHAQEMILELIQQLSNIHDGLNIWVKCLDYLTATDADPTAEKEKNFCMDMLAANSKAALIQMWNNRPGDVLPIRKSPEEDPQISLFFTSTKGRAQQGQKGLKSSAEEIDITIKRIQEHKELDDSDAKAQIEPQIVASLATFNKAWKLDEFLAKKTEIFSKRSDVEAQGISKLQAQFFLQAQAACTSMEGTEGSIPTIAIHLVPDKIPSTTFDNVKSYVGVTLNLVRNLLVEAPTKDAERVDRYTMQIVSLGTLANGGTQWRKLDDLKQGQMDIIDHLPVNVPKLEDEGFGPFSPQKLLLGSVDSQIDRNAKTKDRTREIYRFGRPTKDFMDTCPCQLSPRGDVGGPIEKS